MKFHKYWWALRKNHPFRAQLLDSLQDPKKYLRRGRWGYPPLDFHSPTERALSKDGRSISWVGLSRRECLVMHRILNS